MLLAGGPGPLVFAAAGALCNMAMSPQLPAGLLEALPALEAAFRADDRPPALRRPNPGLAKLRVAAGQTE